MCMAPGAIGCGTRKGRHGLRDEIIPIQIIECNRCGGVRAQVERASSEESERGNQLGLIGK